MKLSFCAACGEKEDIDHYPLVKKEEGGADEDTNLLSLCFACHLKLFGTPKIKLWQIARKS
jgi:hypothetical protein